MTSNLVRFALSIDPRLKIHKSLTVRIYRGPEGTVAYADEIQEFGQGSNSSEALHNLGRTIAELYFSLESQADRLGPEMAALRAKLGEHIQRVAHA